MESFNTTDVTEVLKIICEKGEVQQNASDRKEAMDEKTKQVMNYIVRNFIDPSTKKPHTLMNITNAWEAAKLRVDLDEPVDAQVKKALPKLLGIIKLKRSEITGKLTLPHAVVGQSQAVIRKYCVVQAENYGDEGVVMHISLVPGDFDIFMKELGGVTKGDFAFDIDGLGDAAATADNAGPAVNKNKKPSKQQQQKKK